MAQKNHDMSTIKFLEEALFGKKEEKTYEPEMKNSERAEKNSHPKEWEKITPAQKLNNSQAMDSRFTKSVLSAGGAGQGGISDMGGPQKQLGAQSNNSIWDSGILERLSQTKCNKEKTTEEKQENLNHKNSMKQGRIDEMVSSLNETDNRKSANISQIGGYVERDGAYKPPTRNLSIFDTDLNFDRVPETTEGEKATAKVVKQKDDSWKTISKSKKISNVLDGFFDNLTKGKTDNGK